LVGAVGVAEVVMEVEEVVALVEVATA